MPIFENSLVFISHFEAAEHNERTSINLEPASLEVCYTSAHLSMLTISLPKCFFPLFQNIRRRSPDAGSEGTGRSSARTVDSGQQTQILIVTFSDQNPSSLSTVSVNLSPLDRNPMTILFLSLLRKASQPHSTHPTSHWDTQEARTRSATSCGILFATHVSNPPSAEYTLS